MARCVSECDPGGLVLVDGDLQPDWRIPASWLAGVLAAESGAQVAPIEQVLPPAAKNGSPKGAKDLVKRPNAPDPDALVPITKAEHEKVGRNDPCWCGSGKKFKLCHGAA